MTTNLAPVVVIRKETIIPSAPPVPEEESVCSASSASVEKSRDLKGRVNSAEMLTESSRSAMEISWIVFVLVILTCGFYDGWHQQSLRDDFNSALLQQDLIAAQKVLDKGLRASYYTSIETRSLFSREVIEKACREEAFREFLISQPLLKDELKWTVSHIRRERNNKIYLSEFKITRLEDFTSLLRTLIDKGEINLSDLSSDTKYFLETFALCFATDETLQYLVDKGFINFKYIKIYSESYARLSAWFNIPLQRNRERKLTAQFKAQVDRQFENMTGVPLQTRRQRALRYCCESVLRYQDYDSAEMDYRTYA